MPSLRFLPAVFLASALTAGCAGASGDYPSLAPRPGERASGTFAAPPALPAPPPGTDARAEAEVALAGLLTARAETMVALASLDRQQIEAATAGADDRALADLQGEVAALIAAQDAVLAQLARSLGR